MLPPKIYQYFSSDTKKSVMPQVSALSHKSQVLRHMARRAEYAIDQGA